MLPALDLCNARRDRRPKPRVRGSEGLPEIELEPLLSRHRHIITLRNCGPEQRMYSDWVGGHGHNFRRGFDDIRRRLIVRPTHVTQIKAYKYGPPKLHLPNNNSNLYL